MNRPVCCPPFRVRGRGSTLKRGQRPPPGSWAVSMARKPRRLSMNAPCPPSTVTRTLLASSATAATLKGRHRAWTSDRGPVGKTRTPRSFPWASRDEAQLQSHRDDRHRTSPMHLMGGPGATCLWPSSKPPLARRGDVSLPAQGARCRFPGRGPSRLWPALCQSL
jgi:hypothetical protein